MNNNNNNNNKPTKTIENMFIGGIAGVVSRTLTAPIELQKIQKQTNAVLQKNTLWNTFKTEGITALWKGNMVNCIRIFPHMSINYSVIQLVKTQLENRESTKYMRDTSKMIISSTLAGISCVVLMNPFEIIRTRVSLQSKNNCYNGIYDAVKKTSIKEMYYGTTVSLFGFVPFNVISFTLYNKFKYCVKDKKDQNLYNMYNLIFGGISGITAITVTYPTDLVRRRLHIQGFREATIIYNSSTACVKDIYVKEGISGFYKGLLSAYAKIFPTMALQFATIDYLNRLSMFQ